MAFWRRYDRHLAGIVSILTVITVLYISAAQTTLSQECPQTTYSLFSDGEDELLIEFFGGGGSNTSAKMTLPTGADVVSAQARLEGFSKDFTTDMILDIALVNDVSNSMDDNCHCADATPSSNGYCTPTQGYPYHPDFPCKIEDMKNASKIFSQDVLDVAGNMLGLASYDSNLDSFLALTDNLTAVEEEIDSYSAAGQTCISCGIKKGIEILNAGSNDQQVIILMSDGLANFCIPGIDCLDPDARDEALDEAQRAWDDYNISIITIGFGEDADEDLMQAIANISANEGGMGHYHFVNETDIEHLYEEIASEITSVYPTDPYMDVGSNGVQEWNWSGEFSTQDDAPDYSGELESLLSDCSCAGCNDIGGGMCEVDFELHSDTAGFISLNTTVVIQDCPECSELDTQQDCDDFLCYWCEECSGRQWNGDLDFCTDTSEQCTYSCVQGECGAECDSNDDCPSTDCPTDTCIGNDYYDYPDDVPNDCLGDCTCESNVCGDPVISNNDERCVECLTDQDCSDGDFCNGQEICNQDTFTCEDGPDPDCDDGVDCTDDSCNEVDDVCENIPNDGLCDDGEYCNGEETCDINDGCLPGTPVDCSAFDLPEVGQCDYDPDSNPFTWDSAAGFASSCDEFTDSCTTGSYTFDHECRDDDTKDGVNGDTCGAECDQDTDCVCPEDTCVGRDYHDYPDFSSCLSDCSCSECVPEVIPDDERCAPPCERDGLFGEGHEFICHGDGTYDQCKEDGSGYEYKYRCKEECTAAPECDGHIPNFFFTDCDIYGHDYLQDYCDGQCQIRDDNCESDWEGCTADLECDEVVPGTNSCTYQCEHKPEICYIDGEWGDKPHEYVCREDNTYLHCIDLGSGYGTEYEHVNECSYLCTGDIECDGLAPGTELESCDQHGEDYLQDYCDLECHLQDDDCESSFLDCTADEECDEAAPTADLTDDSCDSICVYHYCGDEIVDEPLGEECDPEMDDSPQCPQTTETCQLDGQKKGTRDSQGDCDACSCMDDPFIYQCVEGECGAVCDEATDFMIDGDTCYYECSHDDSCLYDSSCPLDSFCTGEVRSYNGQCTSGGCVFDTEDCDSLDFHDEFEFYCDGDDIRKHRLFHDFSCDPSGCQESTYYVDDQLVEECNLQDGWYNFGDEPGLEDPECELRDYTCFENLEVVCDYDVDESHDYDTLDGSYCVESDEEIEDRDYYCDASGQAQYVASNKHDCGEEAWSGGGNTPGYGDDPACVFTDHFCVDDGVDDFCDSATAYTEDFDSQDVVECDGPGLLGDHDYWCILESCNDDPPSEGCLAGDEFLNLRCSQSCDAECDGEEDCPPNSCLVRYEDSCTPGNQLVDYNQNSILDFLDVSDECDNTCNTSIESCACSDCSVDCSPPEPLTECVEGVCGAECDEDSDCPQTTEQCDYVNREFCQRDAFGTCLLDSGCACLDDPFTCGEPDDSDYCQNCDNCGDGTVNCGEDCESNTDCAPNTCSETYDDFCEGMRLNEYDSDMVLDSTTVDDECDNACSSCACSDCEVDCSAPALNDYCVEGLCGAECDQDSDCGPYLDDSTCHYDRPCETDCGCGPGSEEFCPIPGTVEQGVCYYDVRDCIDIEGCTLQTCVLEPGQYCDPMEGCSDVGCIDQPPITLFHDASPEKVMEFLSGGGSNSSAKADVPKDLVVSTATVNLTGLPVSFTEDRILDFALVNDVSGSMDDNCNCSDGTASFNGYCSPAQGSPYDPSQPCKIEDMKNASSVFSTAVLGVSGNMIGLVSYATKLDSFLALTDNLGNVQAEIDTYEAAGQTCISCGIRKGIEIVNAGSNIPVMLLLTDGNANRCFAGVDCGEAAAKAEALSEAQRAWDDYGISIITVAFGDDADQGLLEDIADVSASEGGFGSFHIANETDLEDLYLDLATILTQVFPTDPALDAGSDSFQEWTYSGEFMVSETANFTDGLQDVLDCSCPGCLDLGDDCRVDLEILSSTAGFMVANNLDIRGCIPEDIETVACDACSDCGGGGDCKSEGAWSDWSCEYDDVCDETGDCSRSRTVITYHCMNPGTADSFCSSSQSQDQEMDGGVVRDTDGTPCDDGLFCTDSDSCFQGTCTGPPRDCGEDVCDEEADACVSPPDTEEGPLPMFLEPEDGDRVSGPVQLWATERTGRRDIKSALFEYSPDGSSWFPIALDTDGDETPGTCGFAYDEFSESLPFPFERSDPFEGWNATWDTSSLLDGTYHLRVTMNDTQDRVDTEIIQLELTSTRPITVITDPSYEENVSGTVNITAMVSGGPPVRVNFALYPVPDYYVKGVTNKSQHGFGMGQGPNGSNIGNMYCGPTSAASCLDFWADNGFPGVKQFLNGSGMNQTELVESLADLMNTTENGTFKSDYYRSLRNWTQTHGDDFNVSDFRSPSFRDYQRELADKEEDVLILMIWWQWNGTDWVKGGGHYVTGNSVNQTRNPAPRNNTHWADFMNPWTGQIERHRMRDDGWIEWVEGRLWGESFNMVTVSPKNDTRNVTDLGSGSNVSGGWVMEWDTSLFDDGYYFIEAEATGPGGSSEDVSLVRVENPHGTSDGGTGGGGGEGSNASGGACPLADHVVISEVHYDSPANEPYGEWVEIFNPTNSSVDLTDWRMYDNTGYYIFPPGTTIQPGEYLSISHYDNETFFDMYGCYAHLNDFTRPLSNTDDYLSLQDYTRTEIDFVAWDGGESDDYPDWDIFASEGNAIAREDPYCDSDLPSDWLSDQNASAVCSSSEEPPVDFCIVINDLRVLSSETFVNGSEEYTVPSGEATEIEPGSMYFVEIEIENICEASTPVLQIVDVTDEVNASVGYGTVQFELAGLDIAETSLGFVLPGDALPGDLFNVSVLNWNHWPADDLMTWKALSEPGSIQFSAAGT